jgi:hypothetical protein
MNKFSLKIQLFLKNNATYIFLLILLFIWFDFFLLQDINLATADLGRHIKNGEIFWKNFSLPKTNLYSYTNPDFPFVNHHWGSGFVFFLIWKISGFSGLSVFYLLLSFLTLFIFFRLAEKVSSVWIAFPLSILLIPLISERAEIRPEVFSYLFSGIFLFILWNWSRDELSQRWLLLIPIIEILWVNFHIYFLFGIMILGIFFLEQLLLTFPFFSRFMEDTSSKKSGKARNLFVLLLATIGACFINPFGAKGAVYPFLVFQNYGYRIIENQSIWFLEKLQIIHNPNFILIKIIILFLAATYILVIIFDRKKISIPLLSFPLIFGFMACMAIRNFTIFGFFCLPALAYNVQILITRIKLSVSAIKTLSFLSVALFFLLIMITHSQTLQTLNEKSLGLIPGVNAGADFFKENRLSGPIFNNYDIGSYLIFHLYPKEKVFIDNRPEAYPAEFLQDIYIKSQEDPEVFKQIDKKYNFNTVFFYLNDATPWGQNFLITLVDNPDWTPVFVDRFSIIFVKNNEINKAITEKFKIPRNNFGKK